MHYYVNVLYLFIHLQFLHTLYKHNIIILLLLLLLIHRR